MPTEQAIVKIKIGRTIPMIPVIRPTLPFVSCPFALIAWEPSTIPTTPSAAGMKNTMVNPSQKNPRLQTTSGNC